MSKSLNQQIFLIPLKQIIKFFFKFEEYWSNTLFMYIVLPLLSTVVI
jgi:hypothetical protein